MARLEDWAATYIQSLARGMAARKLAAARKLEHMGRWKEMYDEDQSANFYYSKASQAGGQVGGERERPPDICH